MLGLVLPTRKSCSPILGLLEIVFTENFGALLISGDLWPTIGMEIISRDQAIAAGAKRYFDGAPCGYGHLAERYVKGGGCFECLRARGRARILAFNPAAQRYGISTAEEKRAQRREYGRKRYVPTGRKPGPPKYTEEQRLAAAALKLARHREKHPPKPKKPPRHRPMEEWKKILADRKAATLADVEGRRAKWREAALRRPRQAGVKSLAEHRATQAERKSARLAADAAHKAARKVIPKRSRAEKAAAAKAWRVANPDRMARLIRAWKDRNPEKVKAGRRGRDRKSSTRRRAWLMQAQRGRCAICRQKLGKDTHIDHVIPLKLGGPNRRSNLQLTCPPCNLTKGARHPIDHARSLGRLL